jgi:hypothetical protein
MRFSTSGPIALPRSREDGRSSIVDRMAETIREIGAGATFDDINRTGYFTAEEIRRHGVEAVALATQRFFRPHDIPRSKPRYRVPCGSQAA